MKEFDNILNWRLLSGSHKFPGPDGGTCINEAAIIAAGFHYREVSSADDCPPCFSRVIASYTIRLNDSMPDDLRQELLMPFVARLAGTADTTEAEIKRAVYIAVQIVKRILPIPLRAAGLDEHAVKCELVETIVEAKGASASASAASAAAASAAAAADAAASASASAYTAASASASASAYAYTAAAAAYTASAASAAAASAAAAAAAARRRRKEIFVIAVAILDEAIRLGNQADQVDTALVCSRLEAAKQLVVVS